MAQEDLFQVRFPHIENVCFPGEISPEAPIHVLDTAFLPGCLHVTKIGFHPEVLGEAWMQGKFHAIIKGDTVA